MSPEALLLFGHAQPVCDAGAAGPSCPALSICRSSRGSYKGPMAEGTTVWLKSAVCAFFLPSRNVSANAVVMSKEGRENSRLLSSEA